MMMMKNPVVLVACVLLFTSLAVMASQSSFSPDKCCFKFYPKRLAQNRVASYKPTDTRCSMEAVLLTTKKGLDICADPSVDWVKEIMETIDDRNTSESATTPSN